MNYSAIFRTAHAHAKIFRSSFPSYRAAFGFTLSRTLKKAWAKKKEQQAKANQGFERRGLALTITESDLSVKERQTVERLVYLGDSLNLALWTVEHQERARGQGSDLYQALVR